MTEFGNLEAIANKNETRRFAERVMIYVHKNTTMGS